MTACRRSLVTCAMIVLTTLLMYANGDLKAMDSVIKPTTVAGFINLGDPGDEKINIVITKSLINFLSKTENAVITPYDMIENVAQKNGYWRRKQIDKDLALNMAQAFDSKQMIVGDYTVDRKTKKIQIRVSVYDVVTGELKLSRNYSGSSGLGLFDTVDAMSRNIAGLLSGMEISMGTVKVRVSGSGKFYRLYINGKDKAVLTGGSEYVEKVLANEEVEVFLRLTNGGNEVYREIYNVQKGTNITVVYRPMGNAVVKNMNRNGTMYLDGVKTGKLSGDETVTLKHIEAFRTHVLELKTENGFIKKEFTVEEGESSVVLFEQGSSSSQYFIDYKKSAPLLGLAIPGMPQFQAGDWGWGTLFLTLALGGVALFATSEICFIGSFDQYKKAATTDEEVSYYKTSEMWRNLSITGMTLWGGTALFSVLHAWLQTGSQDAKSDVGFDMRMDSGNLEFTVAGYF